MRARLKACCGPLAIVLAGWIGALNSSSAANVRSIELPHLEPEIPVAPGRTEYMAVCVSCHSPRYVMMQPGFSQKQWEQTVDKMTKNYGAQMDGGQRTAIVGYLVTIHGPNWTGEEPARSDDDFTAPPPSAVPSMPAAPPLPDSTSAAEAEAELRRGESLFNQNCAGCHGSSGHGDGVVAAALWRKPKNLAATRFSRTLSRRCSGTARLGRPCRPGAISLPMTWQHLPPGCRVCTGR